MYCLSTATIEVSQQCKRPLVMPLNLELWERAADFVRTACELLRPGFLVLWVCQRDYLGFCSTVGQGIPTEHIFVDMILFCFVVSFCLVLSPVLLCSPDCPETLLCTTGLSQLLFLLPQFPKYLHSNVPHHGQLTILLSGCPLIVFLYHPHCPL